MIYNDLMTVPFLKGGRTLEGLDCYGFLIECLRRDGKELKDIAATPDGDLAEYVSELNVRDIQEPHPGSCVQFAGKDGLHVGYMIDKRTCLHMTHSGVRITPMLALKSPRYSEVIG